MSVTYTIDASQRLIRTRCIGNVTLDEVIHHFRVLAQDPASANHLDVLLDLTETTSLPESGQLNAVVHKIKEIQPTVHFGACAIVVGRDALFGMLRMFEVMAQPYFRATHVFRAASEAETWLYSQRLPAKPPDS